MSKQLCQTEPTHHQSLQDLCTTFPRRPDHEVVRDHLIETIERVFAGPVDLLVLEGDEGIGKTMLLSQFANRLPTRTISSFVTPTQRYGYNAGVIRQDFAAQLLSIVDPLRMYSSEDARDGVLQSLIQRLKRRRRRETYYFLVDALTDIPDGMCQVF